MSKWSAFERFFAMMFAVRFISLIIVAIGKSGSGQLDSSREFLYTLIGLIVCTAGFIGSRWRRTLTTLASVIEVQEHACMGFIAGLCGFFIVAVLGLIWPGKMGGVAVAALAIAVLSIAIFAALERRRERLLRTNTSP